MPDTTAKHELDLAPLEARAGALVEAAKRAGADAADAVVASGRSLSVQLREGKLEENERAEGDTLGLRVFVGRRQAVVSSSDADPAGFAELAGRAVAMARAAPEDRFAGLAPDDRLATSAPDLDLDDPAEPSAAALEALAREAEEAALAVRGVSKSGGAGAGVSQSGFVLATSAGFARAYRRSGFSLSMTAIAGEGVGMQRDYDYSSVTHFADLKPAREVGRLAGERAAAALDPRKPETGRVPVIFDRRVAPSLVGHLLSAANGAAIARGASFLRDKLGARVFAAGVSMVDDPLRPRGPRSRPFDDEGVASAPLELVRDGVLASWLLDSATARELSMASTGHASRGAGSPPSPAPSNVTLAAGARSPAEMMREAGTGLLVTQLIGSGANIVTGDYSRGCFGFWFEGGEIAYPVAEVTIAGRLDAMFAGMEPASDLVLERAVEAPSVFVGELTLAGR
jgi:PmbA protein